MSQTYETLLIEKKGAVDWVTMNRPEALNTLNTQLVDDLLDYFAKLYFDRSVRIVVLRGAGRAFCAGLDIKESSQRRNTPNTYTAAGQRAAPGPRHTTPLAVSRSL